ncbi:hypothetical protein KP509_14G067300 [Ceratopteris richardii]|uniref:Uncharacterized protein n=1 Tax=Ceratopteris richardii TaxID=49495 RepID=A0A8T2TDU4_CERRI|nr:hypothetical protein KP509_14G067300 [Ceratopteris richardii]
MGIQNLSPTDCGITIGFLIASALCEVCGGWCIWKWRREGWRWWFMVIGCTVLIMSGVLPTFQKQDFNRTYALYGGFFICVSFLWGWALDKHRPDIWDAVGSVISLMGVLLTMFVPRQSTSTS